MLIYNSDIEFIKSKVEEVGGKRSRGEIDKDEVYNKSLYKVLICTQALVESTRNGKVITKSLRVNVLQSVLINLNKLLIDQNMERWSNNFSREYVSSCVEGGFRDDTEKEKELLSIVNILISSVDDTEISDILTHVYFDKDHSRLPIEVLISMYDLNYYNNLILSLTRYELNLINVYLKGDIELSTCENFVSLLQYDWYNLHYLQNPVSVFRTKTEVDALRLKGRSYGSTTLNVNAGGYTSARVALYTKLLEVVGNLR